MPFFEGFARVPFDAVVEIMKSAFEPMDILFYGIAVYEGWRFAVKE